MTDVNALTPDELRRLADEIEARQCTGVTTTWCPVHGDCRCPYVGPDYCRTLDDNNCPLHAFASAHATKGV